MATSVANSKLADDILLMHVPGETNQEWIDKLEAGYPGLKVRWHKRNRNVLQEQGISPETWEGVTLYCGTLTPSAEVMSKVRFVQLTSAGADRWSGHPVYQDPKVIFCNASGCHPPQIAEWVIGTWLMLGHHFLEYAGYQRDAKWNRALFDIRDSPGMRMGVLGYGAIGRQCARIASAMGMEIYAYTRSERSTPEARKDDSYCIPGTGDPDGLLPAKWFHGSGREAVNEFLGQDLDIVVISLPLTDATKALINTEQFDILAKKKTFISNIARGKIIDTDALIEALEKGKIRGAALDVTDPEPLPDGHPLWTAPNVYITPHVSWQTPHYFERIFRILETNLEKLDKGEKLINVINREHHY